MNMILKDKLKEFVNFIDDPPKGKRDSILLRLTDQIFYAFGETPDRMDDKDYPDAPMHDYKRKRNEVSQKFKDYGYYNIPEIICDKIADTQINVGDAIDDLVDLYYDFSDFLWRCENTSEDSAIWYFQNPERLHWEEHLRWLQYYLFHKMDEEA